jgi:hypothetical protein
MVGSAIPKSIKRVVAAASLAGSGFGLLCKLADILGRWDIVRDILSHGFLHWIDEPFVFLPVMFVGIWMLFGLRPKKTEDENTRRIVGHDGQPIPEEKPRNLFTLGIGAIVVGALAACLLLLAHFQLHKYLAIKSTQSAVAMLPPATPGPPAAMYFPRKISGSGNSVCTPKDATHYAPHEGGAHLNRPMLVPDSSVQLNSTQEHDETLFILKLVLVNRGEDSIIKDWRVCFVEDGKPVIYSPAEIPATGIKLYDGSVVSRDTSLVDSAIKNPIRHGSTAGGWVVFRVPHLGQRLGQAVLQGKMDMYGAISYRDYLDNLYSINLDWVGDFTYLDAPPKPNPEPGYLPGALP